MAAKAWGGRFDAPTDKKVEQFTESISFDHRLWRQDIAGSKAHAQMLAEVGLISESESAAICTALDQIASELAAGQFQFRQELEDIHMHIETALIERLGDIGRKLHTARSRNDQVATDFKIWIREAIDQLDGLLNGLQVEFVRMARREEGVIIPGYTHLQRAQPILAAHGLLAYVEKFQRDRERLADCRKRVNILPLGAAALAGTSLPVDRDSVRGKLGFDAIAANSVDVSSDRDYAVEFLFCLSLIAEHLSSWAEEWIIWSSTEFGFVELPDQFCTGSSIMPQKKNPDVLELIRGKTGRTVGHLTSLLVLIKGLPLAYNRDLQEDKPPVFDAFDSVANSIDLASLIVSGASLCRVRIAERIELGYLDATTLMERMIEQGVPMRMAHETVGQLVRECEQRGCQLRQLPDTSWEAVGLAPDIKQGLGVEAAIDSFQSVGSTAPAKVAEQLSAWETRLGI